MGVLGARFESRCSPPVSLAKAGNEVRGKLDDDRAPRPRPRPPRRTPGRRCLPAAALLRRSAALPPRPPRASLRRRLAQNGAPPSLPYPGFGSANFVRCVLGLVAGGLSGAGAWWTAHTSLWGRTLAVRVRRPDRIKLYSMHSVIPTRHPTSEKRAGNNETPTQGRVTFRAHARLNPYTTHEHA